MEIDTLCPMGFGLFRYREIDFGLFGLCDSNGKRITSCKYSLIIRFDESTRLAPVERGGNWGYINTQGEEVIGCMFESVADSFYNGLAAFKNCGLYGFFDRYSNVKINRQFEDIGSEPFKNCDIACVKKNGKWGAINTSGQTVIPFRYSHLGFSDNDILCYEEEKGLFFTSKKYGLMSPSGRLITEAKYDGITYFHSNGKAGFKRGVIRGYLDKYGNESNVREGL